MIKLLLMIPEKVTTLDNKFNANEVQHGLNKETGKIFVLPSDDLDKNKYLMKEDLNPRLKIIE